jgi:UDP:flavonoid glycosyltransferase YjiC (YdhE family)
MKCCETASEAQVTRILFVVEAVSLSQVVRLAALARALDPARYEVHFASAHFDELIFAGTTFARYEIFSLPAAVVDRRVARGLRPYGRRTLARYVREELALIDGIRPDVVVGDLRLSLAISAPLAGVPHVCLINAYWSPHAVRDGFPLPDHPIVRLLGVELAAKHFHKALPFVFRHFARPVNDLRRAHGLPELGSLPEILTRGDYTLFPDVPALVPTRPLPPGQAFLGYIPWSPPVALPGWWRELDPARPTVYVTMGSSGAVDRLPVIVDAAVSAGCQVLVATAGRARLATGSPHVHVADYLPGHLAARRAALVVSNGGATTGYQALAEGRPVLGVAFNLDQYLATDAIARAGAGLLLRAGNLREADVARALSRVLTEPSFGERARALQGELARWDARARFEDVVGEICYRPTTACV